MYLNTYLDETDVKIAKYARENTTYSAYYFFWRDELFSRCCLLFKDITDPVPPHEVEVRLMIQGHAGIAVCPKDNELTAFFGTPSGVSKYRDRKPKYCVRSPIWSSSLIERSNFQGLSPMPRSSPLRRPGQCHAHGIPRCSNLSSAHTHCIRAERERQ